MVSYYHNISCTATVTFSQITHGITTSSSGVYTQATTNSSYASEILPIRTFLEHIYLEHQVQFHYMHQLLCHLQLLEQLLLH